jgi:hypothetical protein
MSSRWMGSDRRRRKGALGDPGYPILSVLIPPPVEAAYLPVALKHPRLVTTGRRGSVGEPTTPFYERRMMAWAGMRGAGGRPVPG